ncbi:hypothetical protein Tco_0748008 [Tanacetum coccineum]|uniref:Uncharacterized protein n=1 Tax=Tanacetum coccineum TaxID=301880 RepID=A0ABQ4YV61_9ASTR
MEALKFADSHNMVAYLDKSTENADFDEISSGPTTLVVDETVHDERGDSMEAATTAISLDAEQGNGSGPRRQDTILGDKPAHTRFERLSKQSNDPPLSRVNILGSGEDSMKLNELMEICTKLSERVLALENIKTAQDLEITNLKKRVKKLEKKKKSRTPQLKRRLFKVRIESSAEKSLGDQEDASKQGRNEIDQDEGISWFQEDAETQGRYGHDTEINTASTSITTASINITTAEPVITASAPIATAGVSVSTAEPSTPPTTTTTFIEDEDLIIAQTLMKMRSVKSKEKSKEKGVSSETATRLTRGVIMKEASETATRPIVPPQQRPIVPPQQQLDPKDKGKGIMQEPEKPVKVKGKDQIEYDADMAKRLQAELDEEVRLEREREEEASNAALIEEWDTIEARIDADAQLAERLQAEEREQMSVEERARLLMEFIAARKKFFAAKRAEEKRNKPPTKAKQRNKLCTYKQIVLGDDSAVNIESLATKYPIVGWKTHILAEDKMYYHIIRADGSTKYYKIFSAMLDDFDRQDVLDIYRGGLLGIKGFLTVTTAGLSYNCWLELLLLLKIEEKVLMGSTFSDHVNPVTRQTIDQSADGKLRGPTAKESWALLEDLTLYEKESWNDPRDFAKLVKATALPQDVPSTSDCRLIELENQVQRLMESHLASTQPTQVNKITTSCKICSGPHDTRYCMKYPEQAFIEYASLRIDEARGKWYTFKPEQNNLGDTYNPSWKSHPNLRWRQP